MLPNFLLIGAARCGTTSLYEILQSHEDIYLPPSKRPEPHFFFKHDEYCKGLRYYENRYFPSSTSALAIGEASTSYIFGRHVAERIAQAIPSVKSILMLRNPIERAFSGYWHSVRSGLEKLSFEDAVDREWQRKNDRLDGVAVEIQPFAYVARSDYHEQIVRWCNFFPRESLHIIVLDDFLQKPETVMQRLGVFLGVEPDKFGLRAPAKLNQSWPANVEIPQHLRQKLQRRFEPGIQLLSDFMQRDMMFWLR